MNWYSIAYKHRDPDSGEIGVRVIASLPEKSAELLSRNEEARLNKEFDFASGQEPGTGLGLVKVLLPPAGE